MVENNLPLEIERKFLIKFPNLEFIEKNFSKNKREIIQTYLHTNDIFSKRIRKIICNGKESFVLTEKKDISAIKRIEFEKDLTLDEYEDLMLQKSNDLNSIEKIRYLIPSNSHVFELDIFKNWQEYALMEIELFNENEIFEFLPFMKFEEDSDEFTKIVILKEVTSDKRFRNFSLAKSFPNKI